MIKKLDILVVRAFIPPFIATFFLTLFVLILQFFWLWIDDYVGKGIDGFIMLRLIVYLSATLVPLALPLAVLLSSIMTFGNLGETFELVAIKSAGIGLLRFMRPLLVVSFLLAALAFTFNNYVIPVANLKMRTLHNDLVGKKPAFDLKEGVFYTNLRSFAIKVAKKEKDSILHDIIIYEENPGRPDNMVTARRGVMRVTPDKRYLEFVLQNGWRYEERGNQPNPEFIRLGYSEYKKMFDLTDLSLNLTDDSVYKDRYEMKSVRQLEKTIDSLEKRDNRFVDRSRRELNIYMGWIKYLDTGWVNVTATPPPAKIDSFSKLIPDTARTEVLEQSISYANSIKSSLDGVALDYDSRRTDLRYHLMAWHEKFSMSIAVVVLFLIGAPLGSIVRKGGIGLPLVFAVVFFMIFFLLNNFGKKFVKQDVLQPGPGMWLASAVLVPIGIFLTYKALHDSQLMNKEFYFRMFRGIRRMISKKK